MEYINVKNLKYTAGGKYILNGVTFSIEDHDRVAVLGSNGAGKTTLFENILGVSKPNDGEVIFNKNLRKNNHIAAIWDSFDIFPYFKANEVVKYFSLMYGCKEPDKDIISLLGIEQFGNKYMKLLSKGEKKRVAIAATMQSHPLLLFMDELTSELDKQTQNDVWEMLINNGVTVVFITHKWDEAKKYANKYLLLSNGTNLAPVNTAEELMSRMPYDKKLITDSRFAGTDINDVFSYTEGDKTTYLFSSSIEDMLFKTINTNNFSIMPADIYDVYRYLSIHPKK